MSLHITTDQKKVIAYVTNQCNALVATLESRREEIIDLLLQCESFETVTDEVNRSVDCLKNISKEFESLSYGKVDLLCTFSPVNLPLYSLVLFAIVPSFMASEVVVRPPVLMKSIVQKICELLNLGTLLPNIKFIDIERSLFSEAYVSVADVVLFSGHYKNAKIVQEACPQALFIYNGSGVNPIVVTDSAKIESAVDKTIEARIFNSGQDCHGSDVIFVHEKISRDFRQQLFSKLDAIKIGDYKNREVKIGPLIKVDRLTIIKDFFDAHAKFTVYGGKIDFKNGIVYPTVIEEDIRDINIFTTIEFFAPVFYTLIYHEDKDLKRYFSENNYSDTAMYASIFGHSVYSSEISNTVILQDKILNDVEQGNNPFGGYGPKANYATYRGIYHARPILISYEISSYLKEYALEGKQLQSIL